jgi:Head domain of trimeric autotransporter adhesin
MHTGTLKKLALALTFWMILHTSSLKAQIALPLGPYGTSPITFEVDANGLLSDTGTFGGTDSLSLSGAGTRMFWDPYKAAFRAGYVSGTQWNDTNIGAYSAAFGYGTTASGSYATASGNGATASGSGSVALGTGSYASGTGAVALGGYAYGSYSLAGAGGNADGSYSVGLGDSSIAEGPESTALGMGTFASGTASIAMGEWSEAEGSVATAIGNWAEATGNTATAIGTYVWAGGNNSLAAGYSTQATALDSFVVGAYNVGGGSSTSWVSTDPLFEVGNGPGSGTTPHTDAFVVYKNGSAAFQGPVTVPQSGDIPMFTGY